MVTPDGTILAVGGHNATQDICYNASDILLPSVVALEGGKTWRTISHVPVPRGFLAAALANRTLYTIGGYDGRRSVHADSSMVQAMDLDSLIWDSCVNLDGSV